MTEKSWVFTHPVVGYPISFQFLSNPCFHNFNPLYLRTLNEDDEVARDEVPRSSFRGA